MSKEYLRNRIFISYRKNVRKPYGIFGRGSIEFLPVVRHISNILDQKGFSTFYDEHIGISDAWFGQISEEIVSSELVLLLLSRGTLQSHWVRSEVHFAEALGIRVFPLGCGIDTKVVELELKGAGLSHIQGLGTSNYRPGSETNLWSEIGKDIETAIQQTRTEQSRRLARLLRTRQTRRAADPNQSFARFGLKTRTGETITVHLATGDMASFRNIDVIASSENNLMQMARLIDGKTISGLLREQGARQSPRFDALQRELDYAVDERSRQAGAPLPIPLGDVVATSSGHPNGALRRRLGARYILHVSSAEVLSNGELQPLSDEGQLQSCLRNCLEQLTELVKCGGIISPPDTPQRDEQEASRSQAIKLDSILIPLFGVGRSGMKLETVANAMALELKEAISVADGNSYGQVRNIYIAVFFAEDIEIVRRIFEDKLLER